MPTRGSTQKNKAFSLAKLTTSILTTPLDLGPLQPIPDQTVILDPQSCNEQTFSILTEAIAGARYYSGKISVRHKDGPVQELRALICSCSRGQEISLSLRGYKPSRDSVSATRAADLDGPTLKKAFDESPYFASNKHDVGGRSFLFSISQICDCLAPRLFSQKEVKSQGLILVSGPTNTAKSQLARGLIHRYLAPFAMANPARRPHLVTYENPIEVWFSAGTNHGAAKERLTKDSPANGALACGIDYTAREEGVDSHSLSEAFNSALRQTPAVFYVGEVRSLPEIRALFEFADTGHLVVATAHAATLQNANNRFMRAVYGRSPSSSDRGQLATQTLALIHLRMLESDGQKEAMVPALWIRTSRGIASYVADGASSILPHNPLESGNHSSYGRRWFVQQLMPGSHSHADVHFTKLQEHATFLDLQGH
jgi:Tfp pilus assembly pilus retraction ATPase PilT